MGAVKDDELPATESYPYFWHKESELTLQDFLKKVCKAVLSRVL